MELDECPRLVAGVSGVALVVGFSHFLVARYGKNPMMNMELHPPYQANGSGSIAVTAYNICSGRNGGLESTFRLMEAIGVNIGIPLETKVTDGIYTWFMRGYSIAASNAPSAHQGEIAFFWQPNKSNKVEDW